MQSAGLTVSLSFLDGIRCSGGNNRPCANRHHESGRGLTPQPWPDSTHRTRGLSITPGSQRTGAGGSFPPSFHGLQPRIAGGPGPAYLTGLDTDELDAICDHLIVEHARPNRLSAPIVCKLDPQLRQIPATTARANSTLHPTSRCETRLLSLAEPVFIAIIVPRTFYIFCGGELLPTLWRVDAAI